MDKSRDREGRRGGNSRARISRELKELGSEGEEEERGARRSFKGRSQQRPDRRPNQDRRAGSSVRRDDQQENGDAGRKPPGRPRQQQSNRGKRDGAVAEKTSRPNREKEPFGTSARPTVISDVDERTFGAKTPKVVLREGKEWLFNQGCPLVYSGAVERFLGQRGETQAGDAVIVADHTGTAIGWGLFNPTSMFQVRLMQREAECKQDPDCVLDMEKLLLMRLKAAVELRRTLGLPSRKTTVYRLVNSEGDSLSGLTADVLHDVIVVQSCAAWTERYKTVICSALKEATGIEDLVWRQAVDILKEEGVVVEPVVLAGQDREDGTDSAADGEGEGAEPEDSSVEMQDLSGPGRGDSRCGLENDVKFMISPHGQKTGWYADQRENRLYLAGLTQGKQLLDLCCYTGGFALTAAMAGAEHATGVDSSKVSISLAETNAGLNGLTEKCEFVQEKVEKFCARAAEEGRQWDVVVLDPPKLAPNRRSLAKATQKYKSLNYLALKLVKPGGLLMTCTCSGAMTQSGQFLSTVQDAAVDAQRTLTLIRAEGAGGDHPLAPGYPEGEYLKALLFRVL